MNKILSKLFDDQKTIQINSFDNFICKFLLFLVIIFPFSLISGPFIPDLTIFLSVFFFIYLSFKQNLIIYFNNFIIKFLLLFWLYLIFASLISEDILFSLKSSFFYIRFIIFSAFICFLIDQFPNFKKYFLLSFIFAFSFVIIDSIYQFINNVSLLGYPKPNLRLTGPFENRQIVGSYLSRFLPLVIFLYFTTNLKINFKLNFLLIIFVIFSVFTVLISGERTSLFLITFFLFSYVFLNFKIRYFFLILIIFFSSITFVVLQNKDLKKRFVEQTIQGLAFKKYTNRDAEKKYYDEKPERGFYIYSRAHEVHYTTAFKMFLENKIFGVGPNMFRVKCSDSKYFIEQSSCTTHPHNFTIQILAETGIIGLVFYMIIFLLLFYKIIFDIYKSKFHQDKLNYKNKNIYILHVCFFINCFMLILPSGNFFNNYLCASIFLPLGFYLNYLKNKNE